MPKRGALSSLLQKADGACHGHPGHDDPRPGVSSGPSSRNCPGTSESFAKGLLIKPGPMKQILLGDKTMEVRNFYCRCVKAGETFYLLRLGKGKNASGQNCVELVGKAKFVSNHFIPHKCFQNFFEEHRVSQEDYAFMRSAWSRDRGGCIGWRLELVEKFQPPMYIAHTCQETWLNFDWGQVYDSMDEVQPVVSKKKLKDTRGGGGRGGCEGTLSSSEGVAGLRPDLVEPPKPSKAEVAAWVEMTAQRIEETAPVNSLKQSGDMIGPKEGDLLFAGEDGQQEFAALMKSLGVEKLRSVDTSCTQQTKSLEECMNFYNAFLDEILMPINLDDAEALDPQRVTLEYLVSWISQVSHSSAFSGIGAPETALLGLHLAIQSRAGYEVPPPRILSCVEWDGECQKELSTLADGIGQDFCIFGDISSFWRPELREVVAALEEKPELSVEVLSGCIKARRAMRRKAFCIRHQRMCHLQTAKKHSAGSSCTAHSAQGLRLGLSDKNVLHLLSWIGLRLECLESEIDLENVGAFPTDVLLRFFVDYYYVEVVNLDPRMLGMPCQRIRKYHRLRQKALALSEVSPMSRFNRRFYRASMWSWREFFISHHFKHGVIPNELDEELAWARGRRLSCIHAFGNLDVPEEAKAVEVLIEHYGAERVSKAKDLISVRGGPEVEPFLASLNVFEIEMRSSYFERPRFSGQAVQLNQNPTRGHAMASNDLSMHTLIHNCNLIWVEIPQEPCLLNMQFSGLSKVECQAGHCSRWMTATESLLMQGFPVHPRLHQGFRISCFNFDRQGRRATHVRAQSGNSMCVLCPYVCLLHSAACWRAVTSSNRIVAEVSLFRSTFLSRVRVAAAKAKAKAKAAAADRDRPVSCRSGRPLRRVKGKRKVAELDDVD